ncbi:MAG: tRNA (N6-isopentenyl adenosine(37)-C2)-methylthiotransferase MiaB, partial [Firmicutes bacterium]|nr:tRNA (N6-isopentenyl adenosine(37)-C2)-methylthiotransferase MiaB [Bacillota bacterium]
ILGLMNRRCDIDETRQMLIDLKEAAPQGFKLGTSVIVGFPSEATEELEDTINLCNDLNFDWIYCHGFSARPGTLAATLPGQLSEEEVMERVRLFQESIKEKASVVLDFQ